MGGTSTLSTISQTHTFIKTDLVKDSSESVGIVCFKKMCIRCRHLFSTWHTLLFFLCHKIIKDVATLIFTFKERSCIPTFRNTTTHPPLRNSDQADIDENPCMGVSREHSPVFGNLNFITCKLYFSCINEMTPCNTVMPCCHLDNRALQVKWTQNWWGKINASQCKWCILNSRWRRTPALLLYTPRTEFQHFS